MTTRRQWLLGSASLAVGTAAAAASFAAADASAAQLRDAPAAAQLRTFMRMFCSDDGECCLAYQGTLYGRAPDALPQPLIAFRTAIVIRAREMSPGVFRTEQREAYHYADLRSGALVDRFDNPYTGETVIPIGYVSPLNVYWFDATGSYARDLPPQREGRLRLDWREDDADLWVTESRYNTFPTSITEAEFPRAYAGPLRHSVDILTYRVRRQDLARARPRAVPALMTMVSETPWPLWMMMAKRPGNVQLQGFGRKYARLADLPRSFAAATESRYPGFFADPWSYPLHESGTAAQLRRLRAEGRL